MRFGTYAELLDPCGVPFSIAAAEQIPIELNMSYTPD